MTRITAQPAALLELQKQATIDHRSRPPLGTHGFTQTGTRLHEDFLDSSDDFSLNPADANHIHRAGRTLCFVSQTQIWECASIETRGMESRRSPFGLTKRGAS